MSHPPFTSTLPRYTLSRNVLAPEGTPPITVRRVSGPRCASARKKAGSGESGRATSRISSAGCAPPAAWRGKVVPVVKRISFSPTRKRCRPTRMCRIRSTCYPRNISCTRHQTPEAGRGSQMRSGGRGTLRSPLWTPMRCECGRRLGESQCRFRVDTVPHSPITARTGTVYGPRCATRGVAVVVGSMSHPPFTPTLPRYTLSRNVLAPHPREYPVEEFALRPVFLSATRSSLDANAL